MSEFGPGAEMQAAAAAHEAKMRAQAEAQQPEEGVEDSGEVDLGTADFDQLLAMAEESPGEEAAGDEREPEQQADSEEATLTDEDVTELNEFLTRQSADGNHDSLRNYGFRTDFDEQRREIGELKENPIQDFQDRCAEVASKADELRAQLDAVKSVNKYNLPADEKDRILRLLNKSQIFSGRTGGSPHLNMLLHNYSDKAYPPWENISHLKEQVSSIQSDMKAIDEEIAFMKGEEVPPSLLVKRMNEKSGEFDDRIKGNLLKMLEQNRADGPKLVAKLESYIQENEQSMKDAEGPLREAAKRTSQALQELGKAYDEVSEQFRNIR